MTRAELRAAERFAAETVQKAGAVLMKKYGRSRIAVEKKGHDFATDADLASEKLILREIQTAYPQHTIIAEESGVARSTMHDPRSTNYTWVIDPLDGTKNFQAKIPFWCVTIALLEEDKPVVAATYCPVSGELYTAHAGGGARANGKKIQVSNTTKLIDATVIAGLPGNSGGRKNNTAADHIANILKKVWRMRSHGTAAYELALVARGTVDACIDLSGTTKIWDVAAGILLVREAGGMVLDHTPADAPAHYRSVTASNAKLGKKLEKLLRSS